MLRSRDAALFIEEAICSFHIKGQAELRGGLCAAITAFQTAPSTAFFISLPSCSPFLPFPLLKGSCKKDQLHPRPNLSHTLYIRDPWKILFIFLALPIFFAYFQIYFSAHRNCVLAQNDLFYSEVFIDI